MPGHGTRKRKSCGSRGGTRKQRGGFFGALKKAAKNAADKAAELKKAASKQLDNQMNKNPGIKSMAQGVTATASRMATSQHAQAVKKHLNDAHQSLKSMSSAATAGAASAARTAARTSLSAAISKYEMLFPEDRATLEKMKSLLAHRALNPNAGAQGAIMSKMGGRKKRGHKKRHATKKRGHKKHGHKKRHATKKRGHKKRKQRGGNCGCDLA